MEKLKLQNYNKSVDALLMKTPEGRDLLGQKLGFAPTQTGAMTSGEKNLDAGTEKIKKLLPGQVDAQAAGIADVKARTADTAAKTGLRGPESAARIAKMKADMVKGAQDSVARMITANANAAKAAKTGTGGKAAKGAANVASGSQIQENGRIQHEYMNFQKDRLNIQSKLDSLNAKKGRGETLTEEELSSLMNAQAWIDVAPKVEGLYVKPLAEFAMKYGNQPMKPEAAIKREVKPLNIDANLNDIFKGPGSVPSGTADIFKRGGQSLSGPIRNAPKSKPKAKSASKLPAGWKIK